MVIVVDQLLTGFDSKWINTLYMDKVQENENIIQSFSRTNRLFNNLEKPFGTIKYYRYPFTMKNNIESAVKNYSGDNPFGVFVSSLDTQLKGMNHEYDEIRSVFMAADIPDYSRLPDEAADKRKFSDQFKRFSTYLAAAKIQDFTWKKDTYIFEDDCEIEYTIKVEIGEETYLILLQRYKELSGTAGPGGGADVPYDIDTNITEIDTLTIDTEYMNSRFKKYIKAIEAGENNEKVAKVLEELHRSFAMLSQDEQKFANIILGDINNGNLTITEGKTFRDYITEYLTRSQNDEIHMFAEAFGMNEELLRDIVRNRSRNSDINAFGKFDALMESVDRDKAKTYLETVLGVTVPKFKVMGKVNLRTMDFINGL